MRSFDNRAHHPNRRVDRASMFPSSIPPMSDEQRQRMYGGIKPNFPLPDSAPAGGIQRPEMESCANCGTQTPKGSGSCADCK